MSWLHVEAPDAGQDLVGVGGRDDHLQGIFTARDAIFDGKKDICSDDGGNPIQERFGCGVDARKGRDGGGGDGLQGLAGIEFVSRTRRRARVFQGRLFPNRSLSMAGTSDREFAGAADAPDAVTRDRPAVVSGERDGGKIDQGGGTARDGSGEGGEGHLDGELPSPQGLGASPAAVSCTVAPGCRHLPPGHRPRQKERPARPEIVALPRPGAPPRPG